MLGKELGYEVPAGQMPYNSDYKVMVQEDEWFLYLRAGLEKLTNANRSVSTVNDRLFPVEFTEISDWKSRSEYMIHSNFGKILTRVIGGNFGAYTFILPLSCFLNICPPFWIFYQRKEYLK